TLWLLGFRRPAADLKAAALASLALASISLGASTLHLGRPVHAWKALRGLRRSWLSREVLTLSLFAGAAHAFAGMMFFDLPGRGAAGFATALAGLAGVTCSARIYIVRARPAWFTGYTAAEFFATALLLGPAFVRVLTDHVPPAVLLASVLGGAAQLIVQTGKFFWLSRSETFELRSSSLLLAGRLRTLFGARLAILAIAGILLPLTGYLTAAVFLAALLGEMLGRYLFFVSVVPKNIGAAFTSGTRRAA
ncbi:MAG: DmsC/YnfH family molybdoenzyme membrane anchor subunit, partial [Acidobacteriota bacterium]